MVVGALCVVTMLPLVLAAAPPAGGVHALDRDGRGAAAQVGRSASRPTL